MDADVIILSDAHPLSPSAAAEAETPSATAFQLPGRSIMVLPVGLAIFGGVSLIALIVSETYLVGLTDLHPESVC